MSPENKANIHHSLEACASIAEHAAYVRRMDIVVAVRNCDVEFRTKDDNAEGRRAYLSLTSVIKAGGEGTRRLEHGWTAFICRRQLGPRGAG